MPFLSCPSEHRRRWCTPEFGHDLAVALFDALPIARRRWAGFGRARRCTRCGADVRGATPAEVRVAVPVEIPGAPPFRVELETAGVACARCGEPQLLWRAAEESDFLDAVAAAVFERPGLEP